MYKNKGLTGRPNLEMIQLWLSLQKGVFEFKINSTSYVISDVYYVSELKTNLLSLELLEDKGLFILIQNNMCKSFYPK